MHREFDEEELEIVEKSSIVHKKKKEGAVRHVKTLHLLPLFLSI
jgi:hypothetical protein